MSFNNLYLVNLSIQFNSQMISLKIKNNIFTNQQFNDLKKTAITNTNKSSYN
jgi:hypothetical protein